MTELHLYCIALDDVAIMTLSGITLRAYAAESVRPF